MGLGGELGGHHHVLGQRNAAAARFDLPLDLAGGVEHVRLVQGFADLVAGRGEEGVGDAAADDQLVGDIGQAVEQLQLGRDLGAADNHRQRLLRVLEGLAQGVQLGRQQRAGAGHRRELGHTMGGGLGAVGGAEGVHDVDVAQRRHLLRQRLVVFLLALEEAGVFAQHDLAGRQLHAVDPVAHQRHHLAQVLRQPCGDQGQGLLGIELAGLGAAQVRGDQHRGAALQRQLQGRQGGAQARVRADLAGVDRHIEVLADQQALAGEIEVGHAEDGHGEAPGADLIRGVKKRDGNRS